MKCIRTAILYASLVAMHLLATDYAQPLAEHSPPWYDKQADGWRAVAAAEPKPPSSSSVTNTDVSIEWLSIIIWIAIGLLVGLLLLIVTDLIRSRSLPALSTHRSSPAHDSLPNVTIDNLPQHIREEGIQIGNLSQLIAAAKEQADWSGYIRFVYVDTLVKYGNAGLITAEEHKTNHQYLDEAKKGKSALRNIFTAFERSHFGHQPPTQEHIDQLASTLAHVDKLCKGNHHA